MYEEALNDDSNVSVLLQCKCKMQCWSAANEPIHVPVFIFNEGSFSLFLYVPL